MRLFVADPLLNQPNSFLSEETAYLLEVKRGKTDNTTSSQRRLSLQVINSIILLLALYTFMVTPPPSTLFTHALKETIFSYYDSSLSLLLVSEGAEYSHLGVLKLIIIPFGFKIFFAPFLDVVITSKLLGYAEKSMIFKVFQREFWKTKNISCACIDHSSNHIERVFLRIIDRLFDVDSLFLHQSLDINLRTTSLDDSANRRDHINVQWDSRANYRCDDSLITFHFIRTLRLTDGFSRSCHSMSIQKALHVMLLASS